MPAKSCDLIEIAAGEAIRRRSERCPYTIEGPLTLDIIFKQRLPAQIFSLLPGARPNGATGVRFIAQDIAEATRIIVVASMYDPTGR